MTRRYVSQSLTLGPFRPGCMRNEASAPFLAPFLFSLPPPSPVRRREDGEDPSYDPYPEPAAALRRRCGRVDGVSNSPCGPTRRGNPRANTFATAGFACVNIFLPLADAPMEIGPPNSILRISIRGRKYYRCSGVMNFSPFAVGLPPDDIAKNCRAKVSNISWIILFIKIFPDHCSVKNIVDHYNWN